MNNLTTFYIVRHGETEYNIKGVVQGISDSPLTTKGVEDAKKLGVKFKNIKFDLVFSSDLLRAKRTAEIISAEKKLEVQTTKLLRERNFGRIERQSADSLKAFYDYMNKLSHKERFKHSYEDIESDEKITTRMITFLRETAIIHPGKTILATSHGAIIRTFLIHLGYGTYKNLVAKSISNLAWIRLETDGVDFFIRETKGITFIENE